mmetsp:Transcript_22135/g.32942  ORF Transcript_22135/g.32942 Transcript_22135/m.32942 type:complete len:171 (-) Transcript_22135:469-981(-)|eukprot:CAMPEP_0201558494 /NCGR_PEP_ID=MMETSP0173_2-20130828/68141_1 /ASSEMBLY_ACC=CAM_ASM_000268 /TAXON_ID=218659 /ORGANISM="Vexillifera sp., Strain DIVA3 564/2" /LENGTH=170 /DNA_ID=CAMNT_0047971921 /DNA_START=46 /DNA_END=558 /DNA_ORIENTATION=-
MGNFLASKGEEFGDRLQSKIHAIVSEKGPLLEEKVKSVMMKQKLMELKQMKKQRDIQMALGIAKARDRCYWMTGFWALAVFGIGARHFLKKPPPSPTVVPLVVLPALISYQLDMAFGTKMNRVHDDAMHILEKEEGWWFNEPLDLPSHLKPMLKQLEEEMPSEGGRRWAQ